MNDPTINRGPQYALNNRSDGWLRWWPFVLGTYLWIGAGVVDLSIRDSEMRCRSNPGWAVLPVWPISWALLRSRGDNCENPIARGVYGPPILPPLPIIGETPEAADDRRHYLDGANAEFLCGSNRGDDEIRAVARRSTLCRDYNAIVGPRVRR